MSYGHTVRSLLFKLIVSMSLFGFLFFFAKPQEILASALQVGITTYLFTLLIYLTAQTINTLKWHLLLPEVAFISLWKFTFIGAFYSLLLPGQVSGEAVKTWKLGSRTDIAEKVVASVLIDRLTGIIALLLLALIGARLSEFDTAKVILLPCSLAVVLLVLATFLLRIPSIHRFSLIAAEKVLAPLPLACKQIPAVHTLINHLAHYSGAQTRLMTSIFIGLVFQLAIILIAAVFADALSLSIGFFDLAWIMGIISILIFLPVTIAGIGIRELGFVGLLAMFGIDAALAITLSLLLFSHQIVGAMVGAALELTGKGRIRKQ